MNETQTSSDSRGLSLRKAAIVAGIGLLLMAIVAPVANFGILQGLLVPDNAAETVSNLANSGGSFRLAILLFLVVAVLDVIVAWALYIFLKPLHQSLSLLTAWFRIIYATMLGVLSFFLIEVVLLLNAVEFSTLIEPGALNAQVMLALKSFNMGWEFSLIIFGIHLLLLGYLVYSAGYMKRVLGILLIVAALGYLTDGTGRLLSSEYSITVSVYTFIGEVILIFWLLIKGGRKSVG